MKVGASSLLFQNTTVRGPPVASESGRWMIAAISRLFLPLHVQADMVGGFLTKLAQTPSIRVDVGQGPLDGIHELLVQREGVGFISSQY